MKNKRKFFLCQTCGNMVGLIEDGGGSLVCCGKEMQELKANSVDASKEKHVPVAKRAGDMLVVEAGSTLHPMTEEHHIKWIAIAQGSMTQRISLEQAGDPRAEFCVGAGDITVFAYCNLHGLWYSEI